MPLPLSLPWAMAIANSLASGRRPLVTDVLVLHKEIGKLAAYHLLEARRNLSLCLWRFNDGAQFPRPIHLLRRRKPVELLEEAAALLHGGQHRNLRGPSPQKALEQHHRVVAVHFRQEGRIASGSVNSPPALNTNTHKTAGTRSACKASRRRGALAGIPNAKKCLKLTGRRRKPGAIKPGRRKGGGGPPEPEQELEREKKEASGWPTPRHDEAAAILDGLLQDRMKKQGLHEEERGVK